MLDLRYTQLPFIHTLQKELYPCIPIKAILYFIIIVWSFIFIQMVVCGNQYDYPMIMSFITLRMF